MMNKHGDDPRETHASKSFYAGTSQANEEEEVVILYLSYVLFSVTRACAMLNLL